MVENNLLIVIVASLLVLLQLRTLYQTFKYKRVIDEKNIQLMQLYLDSKFIYKGLTDSLKSLSSTDFCSFFIQQIKDYYNLEEIIVIDSVKMMGEERESIRKGISIEFAKTDIESMLKSVTGHDLKEFEINISGIDYVVYLSRLGASDEDNDGVIICVETGPSLLSKNEKIGLKNCVSLLKNRLMYD
jgi:vacuolar-type H+-ATPase subunit C/Vma6